MLEKYLQYTPVLGKNSWVHSSAVVMGRATLGDDVSVWPNAVIRADVNSIRIGRQSNIQDGTIIHVTHAGPFNDKGYATSIGEQVTIGHGVILHGCTIGNRVLIGMGAIILDGTVIADDVMVGAGALVPMNKHLESGYLYLGSPVKAVRPLTDEEKNFLVYSAKHYAALKHDYLAPRNIDAPEAQGGDKARDEEKA